MSPIDPVTAGFDFGAELLKLVSSVLKFFPDYSQGKIEDYHYHHKRYIEEMAKEFHYRDDGRIDAHREQMIIIYQDFKSYLEKQLQEKKP